MKENKEEMGLETADTVENEITGYLQVKLQKEYHFEGKKYDILDLSNLENMTGADMVDINRIMTRRGSIETSPELTMEYAFHLAARAMELPVEFFYQLPSKECIKVKNRVQRFLLSLA